MKTHVTTLALTALCALGFTNASAATLPVPGGTLQLDSYGVTDLDQGENIPVLHLRLTASNLGDELGWTLDTRAVTATIAGEGTSRAAFVNVDAGTPPRLAIGLGETRTIDLYYPLASDAQPAFTVSLQLRTGSGLLVRSAAFSADLADAQYLARLGHGGVWWYDAGYTRAAFRSRPAFRFVPQRQIVVRPRPFVSARLKNKGKPSFIGHRAPAPAPAPVYVAPKPFRAPAPAPVYVAPKPFRAPAPAPVYVAPKPAHASVPPVRVRAPEAPSYHGTPAVPRVAVRAPGASDRAPAPANASHNGGRGKHWN